MGNFLLTAAIALMFIWAIAFFAFGVGAIIHILLVLAAIGFLVKIFSGNKAVR